MPNDKFINICTIRYEFIFLLFSSLFSAYCRIFLFRLNQHPFSITRTYVTIFQLIMWDLRVLENVVFSTNF